MQLRTFLALDMKDALAEVRAEMGDGAVIVSSEKTKGGGVLVRAALDEADAAETPPSDADNVPEPDSFDEKYHSALIRRLREKPTERTGRRHFDRAELLAIFSRHRLPDPLAHRLAELSSASGLIDMTLALAAALDARMKSAPVDFSTARALLLTGLGGAGKTATAAKLAAHAQLAGRKVMLIGADTQGAGAVARLETFAEHLGVAIVTAESAQILSNRIHEAAANGMLAIIDTAGFDPRVPKAAAAFSALAGLETVETIGVVSAMTDSIDAGEITAAMRAAGAKRLIVTHADLARRLGALVAAVTAEKTAFAYIARSPFVAGGLETPTPLSLARLLVENEEESVQ
jgi:flagellar biosynthesis protein FlhF